MGLAGGLADNGVPGVGLAAVAGAKRSGLLTKGLGLSGQNFDITTVGATDSGTLTSQLVYGSLMGLLAGDLVTNICVEVNQAATSTAPTGIYVGVYGKDGTQLAISGNLKSSSIWTAGTGIVAAPLSAAYTIPSDDVYYFTFLMNGSFAGTALHLIKSSGVGSAIVAAFGSGSFPSVGQSSQATLPSPATFVTNAAHLWFGWN